MNYRIHHNPRCSSSRTTPALLQEAAVERPVGVRDGGAVAVGRPAANVHGRLPA
ncbi:MAG TPA: hypothetical protein VJ883_03520 [Woeseiaceae bacterium]|nr:hypothetical protein [Woeseiaceae bacterium]